MASIRPRYDDQGAQTGWQVRITRQGFPQQNKMFRSKREAETWAASVESQMLRGAWLDMAEADSTTLADALDRYAKEVSSLKKSGKIELYRIGTIKPTRLPDCIY